MAATDKILKKSGGVPIPQFYNPNIDDHSPLNGHNAPFFQLLPVQDSWTGSANITKTLTTSCVSILIANDGATDITLVVGGLTFTIKSGETFDEYFKPFTSVAITTTSAYRAWVRG